MSMAPTSGPRWLAAGARRLVVAWAYLGCFVVVQVGYALLDPPARAAFVAWASTSVANLEHDPVGCLVVSAFVTGGGAGGVVTWLPVIVLGMFGANRAIGGWRTVLVCAAGHVVGTLVSEGIVAWRVASGALPASYRHLTDVGPSYVVVSAIVVALLCAPVAWRVLAAADLLLLVFVARIFAGLSELDVSAVGHLTAIITAAAIVPLLTRHRGRFARALTRQWPCRLRRGRSGT
jgi:hypothetical protein